MKRIYEYLDYQHYLRDVYDYRKQRDSYFSYRYMGQKCGIDAGYLVKVLQGKKHLSKKSVSFVAEFLQLDQRESGYFELLVRYGRGSTPAEIKRCFEELTAYRESPVHTLAAQQYEFYRKWYYSAIWAWLKIHPFTGNYKELASHFTPRLTVKQAKESIALLKSIGMIVDDGTGKLVQKESFISTGARWRSPAIAEFQREVLDLACNSLTNHPREIRDISTVTLAVSAQDFEEIRQRAAEFRKSLFAIKSGRKADTIYQVNLQIVPLTFPPRGGSA
jgi:uncharacterized protein (TIGR02147 family)